MFPTKATGINFTMQDRQDRQDGKERRRYLIHKFDTFYIYKGNNRMPYNS